GIVAERRMSARAPAFDRLRPDAVQVTVDDLRGAAHALRPLAVPDREQDVAVAEDIDATTRVATIAFGSDRRFVGVFEGVARNARQLDHLGPRAQRVEARVPCR